MCSLFHALILRVFLVAPEQGAARMLSTRVITSPAAALELVAGALEQLPSEPVAAQQVGGGGLIYVVPALGEGEGGGLPIIQPHRHTRICSSSSLSLSLFCSPSSSSAPVRGRCAGRGRCEIGAPAPASASTASPARECRLASPPDIAHASPPPGEPAEAPSCRSLPFFCVTSQFLHLLPMGLPPTAHDLCSHSFALPVKLPRVVFSGPGRDPPRPRPPFLPSPRCRPLRPRLRDGRHPQGRPRCPPTLPSSGRLLPPPDGPHGCPGGSTASRHLARMHPRP